MAQICGAWSSLACLRTGLSAFLVIGNTIRYILNPANHALYCSAAEVLNILYWLQSLIKHSKAVTLSETPFGPLVMRKMGWEWAMWERLSALIINSGPRAPASLTEKSLGSSCAHLCISSLALG